MEEGIDFMSALALAVSRLYDMTARDAIAMVMTSRYAMGDFVPKPHYTAAEIEAIAATI